MKHNEECGINSDMIYINEKYYKILYTNSFKNGFIDSQSHS